MELSGIIYYLLYVMWPDEILIFSSLTANGTKMVVRIVCYLFDSLIQLVLFY